MERQLDRTAGKLLQAALETKGMKFRLKAQTAELIAGESGRVARCGSRTATLIPADLVCMAAGIRPNAELAEQAGIECNRGIVRHRRPADLATPAIYAVGECADHRGTRLRSGGAAASSKPRCAPPTWPMQGQDIYEGSVTSTKLKVTGIDVFSAGDFSGAEGTEDIVFNDPGHGASTSAWCSRAIIWWARCSTATPRMAPGTSSCCSEAQDIHAICATTWCLATPTWATRTAPRPAPRPAPLEAPTPSRGKAPSAVAPTAPMARYARRSASTSCCPSPKRSAFSLEAPTAAPPAVPPSLLLSLQLAPRDHRRPPAPTGRGARRRPRPCSHGGRAHGVHLLRPGPRCAGRPHATAVGAKLATLLDGVVGPHPLALGVSGCRQDCPNSAGKDVGAIGLESGYTLYIGSDAATARLVCDVKDDDAVLEYSGAFIQLYREEAYFLEPAGQYLDRVGMDQVRRRVLDDPHRRRDLHDRLLFAQQRYKNPWPA